MKEMRVAVVHDWLVCYGGAERVLEQILSLFPTADVFAVCDFVPEAERGFLGGRRPTTSFVQRLPLARRHYRSYLPVMPLAVEQFDLSGYELIISSSHSVAKGVITGPDQFHLCLCYSPMRYAWDLSAQYLRESGLEHGPRSWLARYLLHRLRVWDRQSANGVDEFIAISEFVRQRIRKVYRRSAEVIYPPVEVAQVDAVSQKEDYYVTVSRLVPYKRVGLMVESFSRMPDRKLIVIGDGPDLAKLRRSSPPNVSFLGHQPTEAVRRHMARAQAFLFAAIEDFGIVAVEAQACGTPVIAFGRGGVVETVVPGKSGILFDRQNADRMVAAIRNFENEGVEWSSEEIRRHALRFSTDRFRREFTAAVERHMGGRAGQPSRPVMV